jgi:hypothetical protein
VTDVDSVFSTAVFHYRVMTRCLPRLGVELLHCLALHQDADGVNPLDDIANEVIEPALHNASGVGDWVAIPMVQRVFPTGNVYNQSIDLSCDARHGFTTVCGEMLGVLLVSQLRSCGFVCARTVCKHPLCLPGALRLSCFWTVVMSACRPRLRMSTSCI